MTYNELTAEVAALGFESEIENKPALLHCANRALRSLSALSPSYETLTLMQRMIQPTSLIEEVIYTPGEEVVIPLRGNSFSMKFSGAGYFTLKERHRVTPFFFESPYMEFCRFLPDKTGELILSGEFSYQLKDIACFPYTYGTSDRDIPVLRPYQAYPMRELTDDFYGFTSLPCDTTGSTIKNAYFRDDTFFIPREYEGEIHLTYRRLPRAINSNSPDAPIDMAPTFSHLLPLLTASYLWLDDDAAKAQFYLQMYMEGVRDIRLSRPSYAEDGIVDTHHWA